jgi:hypothetical protein
MCCINAFIGALALWLTAFAIPLPPVIVEYFKARAV